MKKIIAGAVSAIAITASTVSAEDQQTIDAQALLPLLTMQVETVKLEENGNIVRAGDAGWDDAGDTYPLLNGKYILVTGNSAIDKGACHNMTGCSTNRYRGSVTLVTPPNWAFSQNSVAVAETGHGKNGHGVNSEFEYGVTPFQGGISIIKDVKVGHWCHRDGGWNDGGCSSNLSVTALAVFVG